MTRDELSMENIFSTDSSFVLYVDNTLGLSIDYTLGLYTESTFVA